ncbi:Hypothetical protein GLP15_4164 [Giardia lamblia P15]|uniref:Uncharacterized protein n=1 Tax=Giardia intestinalis (strain P15) TaxID=658858 RepID=E1F6K5_GIAIA|nr:Hypothetical protein GLP15_4164 [Giardia lamblia P15]
MRFHCRCVEKMYRNFVSASPIPLLSVSKAWNTLNDVYQFGGLNDHILQTARDSCFIIRFTAGTFQAFVQAIQRKGAAAYWIIKVYKGHDSYTLSSTIEVRHKGETTARFSMICDISHSYIQTRSAFDVPLACDKFIAEFADKRMGAPALISWSPRCTVFRAVPQTLRGTFQSSTNRLSTTPSSPSKAMVSKGVIVLTPRSPESRSTPTPFHKIQSPQPYMYKYTLCARPSSFEQVPDRDIGMSQSDSRDGEEVLKPIFPVSCRAMIDEYSYYSSIYCISASYMFSSLDILRELISDRVLTDISDMMDPIAKEAQDFGLSFTDSFTDPESTGCVSISTGDGKSSRDDISEDGIGEDEKQEEHETEPPLKQQEGNGVNNILPTDNTRETSKVTQMAAQVLKRIENTSSVVLKANADSQLDSNEIVPIVGEAIEKVEETATNKYIRSMPLHYPILAIPCPDSKPYDSGQYLLSPSSGISSPAKGQRLSDPSKAYNHSTFKKLEDLVQYFCSLIVAGKIDK